MKDKDFIIWMFENHFILQDVIKHKHYFSAKSYGNVLINLEDVYQLYLNETKR